MTSARGNSNAGDQCWMGGPRNQKGIKIGLMNGQAKKVRPALTFGIGLLSTAILISAGSNVQADTGANDLSREFVSGLSSDRNFEDVDFELIPPFAVRRGYFTAEVGADIFRDL